MATTRYRLNENPSGGSLVKDTSGYYEFGLVTAGVAGVTSPTPKEGQRCRFVTGASGQYISHLSPSSNYPLNTYSSIDFYIYNPTGANTWWRPISIVGFNDYFGTDTYAWSYINQSTNVIYAATYDVGTDNYQETVIGTLPRDKWCRIRFGLGRDYGGGFFGIYSSIQLWTTSSLYSITPDYDVTPTDGGFSTTPFDVYIGQTNGELVSPQNGGYFDDVIWSNSPIYRKKPYVIG